MGSLSDDEREEILTRGGQWKALGFAFKDGEFKWNSGYNEKTFGDRAAPMEYRPDIQAWVTFSVAKTTLESRPHKA